MAKRGLGRGLGALIPDQNTSAAGTAPAGWPESTRAASEVPIDAIRPNPHQPRSVFSLEQLQELALSIRQHGLIQPLIVTRNPDPVEDGGPDYQLVAGERRWRAARLAGLTTVPAIIKDVTPQQMLELALVENLQRADLSPLEAAAAYRQLIEDFGLTQEQVAARIGKSRVAVANTVRLLSLPEPVKAALNANQISEGHARALLALGAPDRQVAGLERVMKQDLTVRQTEELVRRLTAPAIPSRQERPERLSPEWQAVRQRLMSALNTKVELQPAAKGGRVVIHFYSEEGLEALYNRLVGEEADEDTT